MCHSTVPVALLAVTQRAQRRHKADWEFSLMTVVGDSGGPSLHQPWDGQVLFLSCNHLYLNRGPPSVNVSKPGEFSIPSLSPRGMMGIRKEINIRRSALFVGLNLSRTYRFVNSVMTVFDSLKTMATLSWKELCTKSNPGLCVLPLWYDSIFKTVWNRG